MKTVMKMMAVLFVCGTASVALADVTELYNKKCASCHGKDGKAATAIGKKNNMKDLTDPKVQKGATDAEWEKIIAEGVKKDGKQTMPPTKATPEEIKELVKYCRNFKK